ncbi:hypothetical protein RY831_31885 [Noviherbaspirillum sp. CPCC 100848]|uniref:Uncharacterized protein n=1 Tax=Noviherbaspirillum album TaxID=3080276 RepID=A0ABU6JJS2_9BURK|nr:hypothetical protein [Noviherbaspirillum sp. CPCC 100848]MEC4723726.1 hypothetical protein [Noviherbaspirillum sp. CPCC 100848]
MTTSTFSSYSASQGNGNYAGNLSRAFAVLIGALFAARPQPVAQVKATATVSEARDTVNLARLYRLSSGRDSLNPALLAELQTISERSSAV